jgi:hypothetical protein
MLIQKGKQMSIEVGFYDFLPYYPKTNRPVSYFSLRFIIIFCHIYFKKAFSNKIQNLLRD